MGKVAVILRLLDIRIVYRQVRFFVNGMLEVAERGHQFLATGVLDEQLTSSLWFSEH
jgi:hypothetical protein